MNRNRIALLVAVLALALAGLALQACSTTPASTPSGSVSAALDALKAQDAEALAKYYSGDTSALSNPQAAIEDVGGSAFSLGEDAAADLTEEQKATVDELAAKLLDFDYAVSNETVDGDKATVDVTITTYDFSTMATSFLTEYMQQAFAAAFSGDTDEAAYQDQAFDSLKKSLDQIGEKNKAGQATVTLTKGEDGTWKVDDLSENEQFADALLGGVISSLTETLGSLASAFNTASGSN